jgi:hypothetical protein
MAKRNFPFGSAVRLQIGGFFPYPYKNEEMWRYDHRLENERKFRRARFELRHRRRGVSIFAPLQHLNQRALWRDQLANRIYRREESSWVSWTYTFGS